LSKNRYIEIYGKKGVSYLDAGQRKILISCKIRNIASHVLTARIKVTIITT